MFEEFVYCKWDLKWFYTRWCVGLFKFFDNVQFRWIKKEGEQAQYAHLQHEFYDRWTETAQGDKLEPQIAKD